MSTTIIKGQKADVTKSNPGLLRLSVIIGWSSSPGMELDSSAFLLGQNGKVKDDSGLIFYGNPSNSFINYKENGTLERQVQIDLGKIVDSIDKIAFTLTIFEGEHRRQNFNQVNGAHIKFVNEADGQTILRYDIEKNFSTETAIVIGELYRYNAEWKFNAIGAGYTGGLQALCGSYGIFVSEPTPESPPPAPPPTPPQTKPNLSKIELTKKGEKINLEKRSGSLGEILINLNWNRKETKGGFFSRNTSIDLDLACLYELSDGSKGIVQALGRTFGSFTRDPYIVLDGDDRSGSVKTGENIRINGSKLTSFRRILVFSFIYEGVSRWSEADGVVTIKHSGGPDIVVKLDDYESRQNLVAIAMIQNVNNETFSIERIVRHFPGHKEMDRAFNWGMKWSVGSK
jgi:tellurite resistance protein TerA